MKKADTREPALQVFSDRRSCIEKLSLGKAATNLDLTISPSDGTKQHRPETSIVTVKKLSGHARVSPDAPMSDENILRYTDLAAVIQMAKARGWPTQRIVREMS